MYTYNLCYKDAAHCRSRLEPAFQGANLKIMRCTGALKCPGKCNHKPHGIHQKMTKNVGSKKTNIFCKSCRGDKIYYPCRYLQMKLTNDHFFSSNKQYNTVIIRLYDHIEECLSAPTSSRKQIAYTFVCFIYIYNFVLIL